MTTTGVLPDSLAPFLGRITDVDSHEMMPTKVWTREFGDIAEDLVASYEASDLALPTNPNNQFFPDYEGDTTEINFETVWHSKGALAPGSTDMERRLQVLDTMGVHRQLMFPTSVGLYGAMLRTGHAGFKPARADIDLPSYTRKLFDAHNAWAIRAQSFSERMRPVAVVQGESPEEVFDMAVEVVDAGIRAVWVLAGELLGGLSPAHSAHDPLWQLLEERRITVAVHIGDGGTLLRTHDWGGAPIFHGYKESLEANLAPWHMASVHLPAQNYTTTMVLGGVFDRFPDLRFGAIEVASFWIGPLARQLDIIHAAGGVMRSKKTYRLPEPPSYYIHNNVRVSAFDWEPVDEYIEMYRQVGIEDVLCFATDYPHVEGGKQPLQVFAERLERLGPEVMEKFFVTNGDFLLPE
jgi:predicted TIM-barrel fold metal-dependent hydrolase